MVHASERGPTRPVITWPGEGDPTTVSAGLNADDSLYGTAFERHASESKMDYTVDVGRFQRWTWASLTMPSRLWTDGVTECPKSDGG